MTVQRLVDRIGASYGVDGTRVEWHRRVEGLRLLQELACAPELVADDAKRRHLGAAVAKRLLPGLRVQLRELRTAIVKEACCTCIVLAERLGVHAQRLAQGLVPDLLRLSATSAGLVPASATAALKALLTYALSTGQWLPAIAAAVTSASPSTASPRLRRSLARATRDMAEAAAESGAGSQLGHSRELERWLDACSLDRDPSISIEASAASNALLTAVGSFAPPPQRALPPRTPAAPQVTPRTPPPPFAPDAALSPTNWKAEALRARRDLHARGVQLCQLRESMAACEAEVVTLRERLEQSLALEAAGSGDAEAATPQKPQQERPELQQREQQQQQQLEQELEREQQREQKIAGAIALQACWRGRRARLSSLAWLFCVEGRGQ